MFGFAQKVEDKSLDFMRKHPKLTKGFITGSTALATIGSTAVVASAEDEVAAEGDMVDTVVSSMSTQLSATLAKVIPAAVGIGVAVLGVSLAWKWMKKFIKGS